MAYHIVKPGTTALRTPYFPEMIKLFNKQDVTFSDYKFDKELLKETLNNYIFSHNKPITKSILAWWAFQNPSQDLPSLSEYFDTEHLYSRNRKRQESSSISDEQLESIGNKSLLERTINIRASDYKFRDKKKYYQGMRKNKNNIAKPTIIMDLLELSKNKNDFTEGDIKERKEAILGAFIKKLADNGLLQE